MQYETKLETMKFVTKDDEVRDYRSKYDISCISVIKTYTLSLR